MNANVINGCRRLRARARSGTAFGLLLVWAARSLHGAAPAGPPKTEIPIRKLDVASAAQVSYARQVEPILADNCLDCHAADVHKGGLDASSVTALLKGGKKAGPAIVPGKPDESPMVLYIRGLRDPQMPKGNPALSEDDLHLIRQWILAGAHDDSASVAAAEKSAESAQSQSGVLKDDPAAQRALTDLVFSGNNADRLIAERKLRLTLLPKAPEPPQVKSPTFNPIDQFIVGKWEQAGLKQADDPPAVCSDEAFVRRAYLDVIGVIPTANEASRFLTDAAPDKRTRLVDELLARNEDYAAHWTPFWEEAIGSSDVAITGGIGSRGNHRDWLFQSFAHDKPFDLMVAELIDPTLPGYRKPEIGEANGKRVVSAYIRNETHLETIQSAANVAQVFLGTEMKCASCHNHFLNKEWPQTRFLAFAGLFATNDLELIRCEKHSGQFAKAKFPFDLPGAPAAVPQSLDQRLHRLTQLLIDPTNPRFAKTIVNRLWKRYLGLGLFEPQDDFRLDQPATNPELLAWLADDFMRHGYDLKHSIRLILTSRTYQLRYDPALEDHFDVNHPRQARYYRSPALRRLTAEELLDSVQVAMTQKLDPQHRTYLNNASTELTRALGRPASRNEISTARPEDVAVVQALELLNGKDFYDRIYSGQAINQAAGEQEVAKAIDRLYWVVLSRPPTADEQTLALNLVKSAASPATAGEASSEGHAEAPDSQSKGRAPFGDVAWALFVSPEFQYIR